MSWLIFPAGWESGPMILNTVRIPISRRGAAAYFIAGWKLGANKKPIPISFRHVATWLALRSIFTPIASRTSALPQRLLIARLPCLATVRPAPATTKDVTVEMLKVWLASPPVPQVSTIGKGVFIGTALARIVLTRPIISSTVSSLSRRAVTKAPNWAGVASPLMISSMTWEASGIVREWLEIILWIASLIIGTPRGQGNFLEGPYQYGSWKIRGEIEHPQLGIHGDGYPW